MGLGPRIRREYSVLAIEWGYRVFKDFQFHVSGSLKKRKRTSLDWAIENKFQTWQLFNEDRNVYSSESTFFKQCTEAATSPRVRHSPDDDRSILTKTLCCNLRFFFRTNYNSIENFTWSLLWVNSMLCVKWQKCQFQRIYLFNTHIISSLPPP